MHYMRVWSESVPIGSNFQENANHTGSSGGGNNSAGMEVELLGQVLGYSGLKL